MELLHLRYALALGQELNYLRAAKKLYITQPTLSQQIKKLETELGFPLFRRSTKQVALTENGEKFLEYARRVLKEYDALADWVAANDQRTCPELSFGASAVSMTYASNCVSEFVARFPEVSFHYVEQWDPMLIDMVCSGELDFALVGLSPGEVIGTGLRKYPIWEEYACAVIDEEHPLHDRAQLTLGDLTNERLVLTNSNSGLSQRILKEFSRQNLKPQSVIATASMSARLAMVKQGGVTFVMNKAFSLMAQEGLKVIPIEPKLFRTFTLITRADQKRSRYEQALQNIMAKSLSDRLGSKSEKAEQP